MRVKRKCELCSNLATIFCESDQAILCYECDSKVHGANFLVAKHLRTLLCHVCQSPTLWSGSGPKFGPTFSVCPTCLGSKEGVTRQLHRDVNDGGSCVEDGDLGDDDDDDGDDAIEEDEDHDDGDYNDDDDDDDDDDDGDDGENQVVPW
ncbi:zinc finger protein CONSTANS-LIKE 3-like [Amaranthus tricolor]|uniref:zinc finger protein CONSTANS-LIKE 3-like n=1 Tax=Amaranthus tricolor TaxID=29722 RepID=UPI002582CF2A|nr:zinc finger protein CONSTANS-LIKE 3-like [Amaranthus tricolor]